MKKQILGILGRKLLLFFVTLSLIPALRELFDAANDPMVTLKDGAIVNNMNVRVTELFGYTTEDLLHKKITHIIRDEEVHMLEDAINKTWELKPWEKHPMFEIGVITKDVTLMQNYLVALKTLQTEIEKLKTGPSFAKLQQTVADVNLDKVVERMEKGVIKITTHSL